MMISNQIKVGGRPLKISRPKQHLIDLALFNTSPAKLQIVICTCPEDSAHTCSNAKPKCSQTHKVVILESHQSCSIIASDFSQAEVNHALPKDLKHLSGPVEQLSGSDDNINDMKLDWRGHTDRQGRVSIGPLRRKRGHGPQPARPSQQWVPTRTRLMFYKRQWETLMTEDYPSVTSRSHRSRGVGPLGGELTARPSSTPTHPAQIYPTSSRGAYYFNYTFSNYHVRHLSVHDDTLIQAPNF